MIKYYLVTIKTQVCIVCGLYILSSDVEFLPNYSSKLIIFDCAKFKFRIKNVMLIVAKLPQLKS